MNMSRSVADASSSAPSHPTDQPPPHSAPPRRSLSTSPPRHTHPADPQNIRGASPASTIGAAQLLPPAATSSSTDHPRTAAPSSDPESARRRRKRSERSSPSGSSSQGDMADTEMEMEGGTSKAPASESAPEGPPPKKKRTRTLTTPHQAAVLHALLAQSRFPTTQMREEVGRSIGLSARKVQIWFQASTPLMLPNQRQKARRPRGQASTTSAPLTRPPQFGPFTNVPPGASSELVSPTALAAGSFADPFFPRGHASIADMPHGGSAPSSAGSERFAYAHRDSYIPDEYARSAVPPIELAGPGIPGPSRRAQRDDPAWTAPRMHQHQHFSSRPRTAASDTLEMYRTTPRPGRPAGEQGPELTLTLPPVMTNVPRAHGPLSSPLSGGSGAYPALASIGALEAGASAHRSPYDDPRRILPPPNVDFAGPPRAPLNIPPPFTLQPQPQWDDPAFSPFSRRRSPPELPHGVAPPFGSSPTHAHHHASAPFRGEPLPSLSAVVPMAPSAGGGGTGAGLLSPVRSPSPPTPRTRFDPIRSPAGRAPPEHPARPGTFLHDSEDDQPPS